MAEPTRLTALDASFLHFESDPATHMHVGSVGIFEGEPPSYEAFLDAVERRLPRVPRYRQRLAHVPLGQGRPVWVDDPHFHLSYHVRHTALPAPGSEHELRRLAGRLLGHRLDRTKPLWELWLVEGLEGDRFAVVTKTHHALVDGISGVDIASILFDLSPDPPPDPAPAAFAPEPVPSSTQLLAQALLERAIVPAEAARVVRSMTRTPRRVLGGLARGAEGLGAQLAAGLRPAPHSRLNVPIGPHRRYAWTEAELAQVKAIKDAFGGTVNDVVLTTVALGLGAWLREHGEPTDDLVLRAMVPVSVRADAERGALGNRVAAMYAPLPVGEEDPAEAFAFVHGAMEHLKHGGQAVGATAITRLADFAPPTILAQAGRLQHRQRFFNLVVTNVPGPQLPLYLLGSRMLGVYPVVPLAANQALGIAILSYDGRLGFGLLSDADALPDVTGLTGHLGAALAALARAAGCTPCASPSPRSTRSSATSPATSSA